MAFLSDILYLKLGKCVEVNTRSVTLGDITSMECVNTSIVNKLKTIKVLQMPNGTETRFVISILKIIEFIHNEYPALEITHIGETDVVVELKSDKDSNGVMNWIKTTLVCAILFFGGAFAIMSFNNDVTIEKLFGDIYEQVMGDESNGFTILEVTYSLGILIGIGVFYNHFGPKKIGRDPTPIEVEMRLYEQDINNTIVDGVNRRSKHLDVD